MGQGQPGWRSTVQFPSKGQGSEEARARAELGTAENDPKAGGVFSCSLRSMWLHSHYVAVALPAGAEGKAELFFIAVRRCSSSGLSYNCLSGFVPGQNRSYTL